VFDQNANGVMVPHSQAQVTGNATGSPVNGLTPTGSTTSFNFSGVSKSFGWPQYCQGCEINEFWDGTLTISNDVACSPATQQWGMGITANVTTWPSFTCSTSTGNSAFFLTTALPATFTVQTSGLTAAQGRPIMQTYAGNLARVSTVQASSVSTDGTLATFSFPKAPNGTALPAGHYAYEVANVANGVNSNVAVGFFSIGNVDTTTPSPYGVDAAFFEISQTSCTGTRSNPTCTTTNTNRSIPIVTSSSSGTAVFDGKSVAVGSQPLAVHYYDRTTTTFGRSPATTIITGPTQAIVSNFASNTVSILSVSPQTNPSILATINVGTNPGPIVISGQNKAYVANYGGSSVTEINLGTNTVSRTIDVGAAPAALTMAPGGTALWVGGLNYVSEIDLSSLSVLQTLPSVSGQVTSIGVSAGENAIVYTTISTDHSTFSALQANVATAAASSTGAAPNAAAFTTTKVYQQADVANTAFANPNPGGGAAPGFLASNSALVSENYGNRYCVIGTPTGFKVLDMQSKTDMLDVATSNPVRGIATENGMIYITVPGSNSLYSVPYAPIPDL
jgi:YVTN family beta-propeller protein